MAFSTRRGPPHFCGAMKSCCVSRPSNSQATVHPKTKTGYCLRFINEILADQVVSTGRAHVEKHTSCDFDKQVVMGMRPPRFRCTDSPVVGGDFTAESAADFSKRNKTPPASENGFKKALWAQALVRLRSNVRLRSKTVYRPSELVQLRPKPVYLSGE